MCTVSMVGDGFNDRWKDSFQPPLQPNLTYTFPTGPTRQQFDDLKKEVELMKDLLKRAKLYDEANNEPDCEMEDKVKLLRGIAELVGVDLSEIFGKKE